MAIVAVIIGLAIFIIGWVRYRRTDDDIQCECDRKGQFYPGQPLQILGAIICASGVIASVILMSFIVDGWTLQGKIDLMNSENANIDNQICGIVENYKDYEQSTLDKVSNKSADVIVQLYPELKSDKLISKQIDIYTDNKQKIISFKEELINQKPYKWWLYFG